MSDGSGSDSVTTLGLRSGLDVNKTERLLGLNRAGLLLSNARVRLGSNSFGLGSALHHPLPHG